MGMSEDDECHKRFNALYQLVSKWSEDKPGDPIQVYPDTLLWIMEELVRVDRNLGKLSDIVHGVDY